MISESTSTRNPEPVPIYLPGRSKPNGFVREGEFYRLFSASRHMLRRPPALGFDVAALKAAEAAGAQYAVLQDLESGSVYRASFADIWRFGFPLERGHGRQIALALDRWEIDGRPPKAERVADTNQERLDLQLGLFSGSAS